MVGFSPNVEDCQDVHDSRGLMMLVGIRIYIYLPSSTLRDAGYRHARYALPLTFVRLCPILLRRRSLRSSSFRWIARHTVVSDRSTACAVVPSLTGPGESRGNPRVQPLVVMTVMAVLLDDRPVERRPGGVVGRAVQESDVAALDPVHMLNHVPLHHALNLVARPDWQGRVHRQGDVQEVVWSGLETLDAEHAPDGREAEARDAVLQGRRELGTRGRVDGLVRELRQRAPRGLPGGVEDGEGDEESADGIEPGPTPEPDPADGKGGDEGGEGVHAVVVGVGLEEFRALLDGNLHGRPVEPLLEGEGGEAEPEGVRVDRVVVTRLDVEAKEVVGDGHARGPTDPEPADEEEPGDTERSQGLHLAVAVRVVGRHRPGRVRDGAERQEVRGQV